MRDGTRIDVVKGDHAHLPGMVACHIAAFPGQFMTRLGERFLDAHYRFYLDAPDGITAVAVEGPSGRVAGFVMGGDPAVRARFTRQAVPRLAPTILWAAMTDRRVAARLAVHAAAAARGLAAAARGMAARLAAASSRRGGTQGEAERSASLLSICVHPDFGGRGVGRALMEAFRQECARRGYLSMRLSVHRDNEVAVRLYRAAGWEVVHATDDALYFRRGVNG